MSRVVKSSEKHHVLTVRSDSDQGELLIVGPACRAYLWCGGVDNKTGYYVGVQTFSNRTTLRKLRDTLTAVLRKPRKRIRAK